ncbi:MAG: class I SAM-dependent methyltransferase [bacterium]|nr:class I SAM-dependent methyltransferase [bacterium]
MRLGWSLNHRRKARSEGRRVGCDARVNFNRAAAHAARAVRVGDLEEMPIEDKSFDVVFAANAVQFTYDPAQALTEIKRLLAPNGKAIVAVFTDIERNNMGTFIKALAGLLPQPPKVGPFALGKPGLLETAIERAAKVVRDVEVPCDFVYPDVEDFWVTSAQPARPAPPSPTLAKKKTKQTRWIQSNPS